MPGHDAEKEGLLQRQAGRAVPDRGAGEAVLRLREEDRDPGGPDPGIRKRAGAESAGELAAGTDGREGADNGGPEEMNVSGLSTDRDRHPGD